MPMRLSDKVAFVEKNEKLIVDAALDYRRSKCPETCDRFIVSLSLVWGGDEQGRGEIRVQGRRVRRIDTRVAFDARVQ